MPIYKFIFCWKSVIKHLILPLWLYAEYKHSSWCIHQTYRNFITCIKLWYLFTCVNVYRILSFTNESIKPESSLVVQRQMQLLDLCIIHNKRQDTIKFITTDTTLVVCGQNKLKKPPYVQSFFYQYLSRSTIQKYPGRSYFRNISRATNFLFVQRSTSILNCSKQCMKIMN